MSDFNNLAQQILTDVNFPSLPDQTDDRRSPNYLYPSSLRPTFAANWQSRRHVIAEDKQLHILHFNWVQAYGTSGEESLVALDELLKEIEADGEVVGAISGRVTDDKVLSLVDRGLERLRWRTFVSLGGQAFDLSCITSGPQSGELRQQVIDHTEVGSPFVAFSPDLELTI